MPDAKASDSRRRIAVIGGGAKAAALAAHAATLRRARISDIEVVIFERHHIGSAWTGRAGYTNGKQRLCTPIERDLGFPYNGTRGGSFDYELYREFSWASFLLGKPRAYRDWVDAGRLPPTHETFAHYLSWAVRRSGARVVYANVDALTPSGQSWRLRCSGGSGVAVANELFDGVVISSPGPARTTKTSGSPINIYNGEDFWARLSEVRTSLAKARRALEKAETPQIVIIGAGGTAAAILAWLVNNGFKDYEIVMVAEQAALFTRGDSVFENRLFGEDEAWKSMSSRSREEFERRLNRGVVWSTVMDQVTRATRLVPLNGRALKISALAGGLPEVIVKRGDGVKIQLRPSVVIDASGFDTWWFMSRIRNLPKGRETEEFRSALVKSMAAGLHFGEDTWPLPRLHAPFLCSEIGPGYGGLMALGAMADRVLRSYDIS